MFVLTSHRSVRQAAPGDDRDEDGGDDDAPDLYQELIFGGGPRRIGGRQEATMSPVDQLLIFLVEDSRKVANRMAAAGYTENRSGRRGVRRDELGSQKGAGWVRIG